MTPKVIRVTCPKCHGRMRTVDRQGVHIEQCENCRGIFLDHGELEQMLSAEAVTALLERSAAVWATVVAVPVAVLVGLLVFSRVSPEPQAAP